jgi:hypothetical protein
MSELQEQFDAITIQAYELRKQEKYEEALKLVQPFADKGLPIAQHIVATFTIGARVFLKILSRLQNGFKRPLNRAVSSL